VGSPLQTPVLLKREKKKKKKKKKQANQKTYKQLIQQHYL
jgi:hypothetical protein